MTKKLTKFVLGPGGTPITLADLPKPGSVKRWVARRKAEIVCAVEGGLLPKDTAFKWYNLNENEWIEWKTHWKREGIPGLKVTHLQDYRDRYSK